MTRVGWCPGDPLFRRPKVGRWGRRIIDIIHDHPGYDCRRCLLDSSSSCAEPGRYDGPCFPWLIPTNVSKLADQMEGRE